MILLIQYAHTCYFPPFISSSSINWMLHHIASSIWPWSLLISDVKMLLIVFYCRAGNFCVHLIFAFLRIFGDSQKLKTTNILLRILDTAPIQSQYSSDTVPIQSQYSSNTIPIRSQYRSDTILIQSQYGSGTVPIQFRYSPGTVPMQSRYSSDTIPVRSSHISSS